MTGYDTNKCRKKDFMALSSIVTLSNQHILIHNCIYIDTDIDTDICTDRGRDEKALSGLTAPPLYVVRERVQISYCPFERLKFVLYKTQIYVYIH